MKRIIPLTLALGAALAFSGCSTYKSPSATTEKGPEGTVAYYVKVESSEPARIDADNDYVGKTPLILKIYGDKDGTFHHFGSFHYVVVAHPIGHGQPQTKEFHTGGWFTPEEHHSKADFLRFLTSYSAP